MRRVSFQAVLTALVAALVLSWAVVPQFGAGVNAAATQPIVLTVAKSVTGGKKLTVSVALTKATPKGGAKIVLTSSNSAIPVPASVTIPAGSRNARVSVVTLAVTRDTASTISAAYAGPVQQTVAAPVVALPRPSLGLVDGDGGR